MRPALVVITLLDILTASYIAIHFLTNLALLVVSLRQIRNDLKTEHLKPAARLAADRFLPTITLLVPAYNEEVTIVESLRSLLRLQYPAYEIIICNDGSKDKTVDVLRDAFHFVPIDLEYDDYLGTSSIRAFYEARIELPPGLQRIILIDKENGGKADALNAAINVSRGDFVTSMDADSLLIPEALLMAARAIRESPEELVAIGGQVGLSNGSLVEDGRVVEMRLPKTWIGRFQVVEYMRSFAQGRVGLAGIDSLLILSGVFALLRRDLVLAIGGFLTRHMRSRIGIEYCGKSAHTVCEDMEVVVRLHRYLLDRKLPGKVAILPFAIAWTEAPENYRDIGKQRSRWYRGLLEVLVYHRAVLFRPRFRQIGMFSLPYQLVFEALAPVIECIGLVALVLTLIFGVLSSAALVAFVALAMAVNLCLSSLSIALCLRSERAARAQLGSLALFSYSSARDGLMLMLFGFLSNFGYRQFLVGWQLKGLWDFLKGKKGWDKFARKGFATKPA